ncbi:MAG: hypothetical protein CFH01_01918, partial [Alphaproteobacteria bacterium MarineAlpha2_Bin1]
LNHLAKQKQPLTAYTILDALRGNGLRAPLQVYRALNSLVKLNKVHKIDSMNAFIACNHHECENPDFIAFTICDECENVSEIKDKSILSSISKIKKNSGFKTKRSSLELHGLCRDCKSI